MQREDKLPVNRSKTEEQIETERVGGGNERREREGERERSHLEKREGASWMELTRTQREESAQRSLP